MATWDGLVWGTGAPNAGITSPTSLNGTTWSSYEADGVEPLGSWATGGRKVSLLLLREERRGKGIGLSYRSKPQLMDEYT